jgi:pimeloyl-ACP methyl ester carboxylesterase
MFDLPTVQLLFQDFTQQEYWDTLEALEGRTVVHFVRAGRNASWSAEVLQQLGDIIARSSGHVHLHTMPHVGHWLHVEDLNGLLNIMSPSFAPPE